MARVVTVHHFTSFSTASAPDSATKCIHPIQRENNRLCSLSSNVENRPKAAKTLREIRHAIGQLHLPDLIRRYAVLRCCQKVHEPRLEDTFLLDELVTRWVGELNGSHPSHAHPEPTALALPTSVSDRIAGQSTSRPTYRRSARLNSVREPETQQEPPRTASSPSDFTPYVQDPRYTVESKLKQPLKVRGRKTGTLYLFTRPSSPGFVKIGYTTGSLDGRMNAWEESCHYRPVVEHRLSKVPHVFRVEGLVHAELSKYWRREKRCKHNPNCPTRHQEWFEIDVDRAKAVMNKWANWMAAALPYDEDGFLKDEWVSVCWGLKKDGKTITAQTMLENLFPSSPARQLNNRSTAPRIKLEVKPESPHIEEINTLPNVPAEEPSESEPDIAKLSSLLEELSRELRVMSYQRPLRSNLDTDLGRLSSSLVSVQQSLRRKRIAAVAA